MDGQPMDGPLLDAPQPDSPQPDLPRRAGTSRRRTPRLPVVLAVAVLVLAADIISKVIVVATLSDRHCLVGSCSLPAAGPAARRAADARGSRNPGAAFSIGGTSTTIVFTAIAVGVIIFILRTSRQIRSLPWAITLGLLLGGATGNLTDRLLRSPGPLRG